MTPRAIRSLQLGRKRTLVVAGLVAILALILAAPSASAALATLTSISTIPASPTTCDSVTLVVAGTTPTPCYEIVSAEMRAPIPLPSIPELPPSYEIQVRIVLRHTNPPGGACPTVIQPYEHAFPANILRLGRYWVRAVEYILPADSNTPVDSSALDGSFNVTTEGCPPHACYLLGFGTPRDPSCHASAPPGGRAVLPVLLTNSVPVGGVQTVLVPLQPTPAQAGSVSADSHLVVVPVDVETTDRSAGFQVAWTAEGNHARIILYSTSGAEIPPGQGPILRVAYQVSSHAQDQVVLVSAEESVVADPRGDPIPPCPTMTLTVDWGRICIGGPLCDLNEDGGSNILDIVQLVNCALAGPGGSETCPETVMARADCNGDGRVDVRDVICCVRKILGSGGFGNGDPGVAATGEPTRIGFTGPVQWTTPLTGRTEIRIEPGASFAGIDFAINAAMSGARIAGMRLAPGSGYQLESKVAEDGTSARAMLLAIGGSADASSNVGEVGAALPAATIVLEVTPSLPASDWGSLVFSAVWSANQSAQPMRVYYESASTPVPEIATPLAPSVSAARPNPFRGETEIAYALPTAGRTTLRVYSASGRLVRTLVDSETPAGVHRAHWDGRDSSGRPVSSGIYFFRFSAGDVTKTQRLMLLR